LVDETDLKAAGQWRQVDRAADQFGQPIDGFVSLGVAPSRPAGSWNGHRHDERGPVAVTADRAAGYPVVRSRSWRTGGGGRVRRAGLGDLGLQSRR